MAFCAVNRLAVCDGGTSSGVSQTVRVPVRTVRVITVRKKRSGGKNGPFVNGLCGNKGPSNQCGITKTDPNGVGNQCGIIRFVCPNCVGNRLVVI